MIFTEPSSLPGTKNPSGCVTQSNPNMSAVSNKKIRSGSITWHTLDCRIAIGTGMQWIYQVCGIKILILLKTSLWITGSQSDLKRFGSWTKRMIVWQPGVTRQKSSMSKLLLQFLNMFGWHFVPVKYSTSLDLGKYCIIHRIKVHILVNNKPQKKFGHTRLLPLALFGPFLLDYGEHYINNSIAPDCSHWSLNSAVNFGENM